MHTDLPKENLKPKKTYWNIRQRLYIKQKSLKPSAVTVVSVCWHRFAIFLQLENEYEFVGVAVGEWS